ncbi:hypothetical protein ON010_g8517 [Phytophthora cinnamomi]|nr:hypothetical protein ON010_g8517 [Phytophthora cinnamomi]
MGIKVAWPLLVSAWVSPLGGGVTGALRFATVSCSALRLRKETETYSTHAVSAYRPAGDVPRGGAHGRSCGVEQGVLPALGERWALDRVLRLILTSAMAYYAVALDFMSTRHVAGGSGGEAESGGHGFLEAQQILSSIVYQPDANYDSGMWDDPMCITQRGGNEIIRMQLLPVIVDAPSPSKGMCVAADMADDLTFEAEGGSTHEKKISVVSVNDPPKTERERRSNVPVLSRRSCVGLTTSEQEDAAVSSTTLQQKFDDPPDMLVREAIMAFEDTDMLLGGEVNLDAFVDLKAGSTISVSVPNGVVYSVGDGVHIDPSSKQQISTNDVEHLRSVLSNLRYIPNPNFNGIDEIDFNARGETATLYIYVQAENDPPKLEFESDEMKDWYKYPRMFLPSFQVEDPDSDQIFQVDIHVENGTLFVEQMSTRAFDGISVEFNASLSSLRLTSGLSRLNTLFLQRLVEVVPKSCLKGTTPISCTAIIELCVNDGSISYCEMINLPEQDAFYRVTVSSWAKSLNVTAESSLNISEAFKIHQRFDVMYELLLRVHVSSGFCRIGVPNCGALRDFYSPSELQPSNLLGGMTKIIYAGDADCLNKVLASIQLQSSHVSNTTVVIKAELLTAQMRLLASESISVVIIDKPTLIRISAVRINGDEPWLVGIDNYTNLTSLVNISIVAGPEAIVDGTILELEVFCQNCLWKYRSFVPQVSYEHAQIPNSKLKFLGLYESLRKVIAILQLSVNYNSADAEVIHLQMSLASPLSERVWGYDWNSSTEISIPFTLYASNLLWEAQRNLQFVQAPNDTVDLSGVKLIGKDETPSLNLTILLDCTLGQAKVSLPRANPTFLELPCDPNQPPISLTMQRSQVNDVMQSTLVKVVPSERSLLVQLHLAAVETAQIGVVDEAFIDLEFRVSRQLSETRFALRNESRAIQVDEEKLQSIGEILTVTGNPNEPTWFRMLAHVTHGRLSVPIAVCCVEIRETEHENEVDIIGTALALERAIAVVQFQGHEQYSGKDLLEMTFASFPTNPDHPNTSLVVAIDIVAVNHASNKIMLTSVNDIDSLAAYDAAVIPSWSQPSDLEALDTVTNDEHVASFLSSVAPDTSSIRTERDSFIALKTTLLPLIHIEGSIEGPLSSQYWEIITLALSVGMEWSISGVSIRDSSGEAFVSDDDLTLEIDADIGTIHFAACDGLEISEGSDDMFTRTITVIGKLELLNAALLTLRYLCSSCCNRQDTVTFQVSNPLAPPPEISHKRVIKIDQLHDVPVPHVITNASLYYSTEDEAFQFPNLTLRFADNNDSPHEETPTLYQLDIQVSYGDIFLVNADDSPRDGRMLKLEGTVINLERNLTRMIYLPPQNWNEEQFPGGHIVKWKFTVSYENESVETFADIVITPRVDIPVITVPQSVLDPSHYMSDYLSVLRLECLPLVCDEDTPMQLDGFFVRAADATKRALLITDLLVLSMSVTHGVLTLGDPLRSNCISQLMGPQSWRRVSFSANAECINRILSGMTYVGEPNFSGADQLKIRVEYARKLNAAVDEVTVPIIVVELNDAPYIEARSVFYEAVEDIPLVIEGLYLRDPDANEENLRVVMETSCGQLTLLRSIGINQTVQTMENGAMRLTLEGTLWSLNAAIASVVYTSAKDWNSLQFHSAGGLNGFDTITINSSDLSSFNASSISVLFLYVDADVDPVVIDTPSNVLTSIYADDPPGTLRGDEDTWIGINGLVFSSVDDTSQMTLVLSLSVVHGILSLSQLRGITFLEGTDDLAYTVKIKGTFLNVNECVAGLRYIAHENYYGKDTLIVVAYAVDQYTEQQTPSSLISVAITVDPVNDAPLWNTGSSITREIQQGRSARIAGVYFGDVDVAVLDCTVESCMMDLIVEASQGFVTLSNQSSTSFSNDMTIKKIAYVVVSGTPDELNTMLSKMTFEFDAPEYYRADNPGRIDIKLQLTVDDRGTFGRGGPQISTTTVVFSPVTWTQHELSILAPEDVLEMEEDTTFYFNGDLQLIDLDSARSFYNLLELTIDCTGGAFALSDHTTGIQVLRNESGGDVVVRGYFAQLNAALNGSSYIPATNWYGSEKLSLSVVELNHLEKSSSVAIGTVFLFVAPVCDEPEWKSQQRADESLSMKEDGYMLIDSISLASPDLGDEQHEVKVLISVNHGGIMLSMMKGLFVEQAVYSTSEGRLVAQHIPPGNTYPRARLFFEELVFRGRVSDINSALKGMIFKPWLDYNSDGWPIEEISFIATSSCGDIEGSNKSSSSAIAIAVDAVNDPPVLISKHFQLVSLPYSLRALNAISSDSFIEAVENLPQRLEPMELYDPDYELREGDLRLLVNISCIHCIITSMTLSEHQPSDDLIILTSSWGSRDGTQLVVHGGLSSLNSNLLSQLTFQGADNFNGIAFVLIEISDLGNYGEGGEQHTLFALGVDIAAVNDIPQIHFPQFQSQEPVLQLDEDASVLIVGAPALSSVSESGRRQTLEWSLMSTNLIGNESTTRLYSLSNFLGSSGIAVSFLVSYNSGLLFSGQDPDLGEEIWYSDGTAAGTNLLKDIFPGCGGSSPSYLTPFSLDNRVYFAAEGPHLSWLVKDVYRDECQSFRQSSLDPDIYYTVAALNVWDPEEGIAGCRPPKLSRCFLERSTWKGTTRNLSLTSISVGGVGMRGEAKYESISAFQIPK